MRKTGSLPWLPWDFKNQVVMCWGKNRSCRRRCDKWLQWWNRKAM